MKYVIIGGVAGGASTAARLRRLDEKADIVLFEKGKYISYANCGLPYYIGDVIKERDRLFVQTPESFEARFKVKVKVNSEVKKIDRQRKVVLVEDVKEGKNYEERYDKLVLSPGADPIRPPLDGIDLDGIFTLRNVADIDRIKTWADEKEVKRAIIVGAGFVGLEMAENLYNRGIKVTVIEMADQVMTPVDFEIAAVVHQHFKVKKAGLLLQEAVSAFSRDAQQGLKVHLKSGKIFPADMVILSIGVRPDTKLAREAELKIGETGGIWVNEYLQTSDPDIYAVGDAIEFTNPLSRRPSLAFLAGPANKQGRICANNIVEGNHSVYKGSIGTAIAKIFDLTVGTSGLSARLLQRFGIAYQEAIVHVGSHAGYYPGAIPVTIKINFSPENCKLLGAQVVGYEGADKRLDMMATVIGAGGTVYDLMELEHAYAPPYSAAKDPVNIAGFVADNILSGQVVPISWRELKEIKPDTVTLINVCTKEECALHTISGAMNIPLDELRSKLETLPKDKPVILFCAVGLRGYIAAKILMQNGFSVRNLTGGIKTYEAVTAEQNNIPPDESPDVVFENKAGKANIKKLSLDACGLQCPGPVLKLKSGMDQLAAGDRLEITATDPGFVRDAESWAKITGNRLISMTQDKGTITAVMEKGAEIESAELRRATAPANAGKTIVVFSDDLDRALASFIIANGAASTGRKVSLFFTFWGLNVIKRHPENAVKKNLTEKMFGMMLPSNSRKLSLSKMNMFGMGSKMMRNIMKKKQIASLESLIRQARDNGVEFIACQMSMDVMGVKPEELLDGVKIGGVATYLMRAEESNVNLFI